MYISRNQNPNSYSDSFSIHEHYTSHKIATNTTDIETQQTPNNVPNSRSFEAASGSDEDDAIVRKIRWCISRTHTTFHQETDESLADRLTNEQTMNSFTALYTYCFRTVDHYSNRATKRVINSKKTLYCSLCVRVN